MLLVGLNLLCGAAATATHAAAFLRQSPLLTTVPSQPVRVGQPSMQMPFDPYGRNWARSEGEHNAAYRARRRAKILAEHASAMAAAHQSHPQSSEFYPPHSTSHVQPSSAHGLESSLLVLLFDAGRPDEGVYTQTQPDGSATILTFECADDAHRFGQLLLTKGFDRPTPTRWARSQLTVFLSSNKGLGVSVVPRGTTPEAPSGRSDHVGQPGPERAARPDQYTSHRLWLDQLMGMHVDNCGDDDCILG